MSAPPTHEDPAARVRQLLLSGDNIIKNRDAPERFAKAADRYRRARQIAVDAGLDPTVLRIIDLRLQEMPEAGT